MDNLIIIVNQPHWENSLIEKSAIFSIWNDRTWTSQFFFVGVEFLFLHISIFMCQCAYVTNILDEFQMTRCNWMPMPLLENGELGKDKQDEDADLTLYRWIINKLIYLTNSCLDLTYVVGTLNRYMIHEPAQKNTHGRGSSHSWVSKGYPWLQNPLPKQGQKWCTWFYYVIISDQIANILTKSLGRIKFQFLKNKWDCKVFVDVKQNDLYLNIWE